MEIEVPLGSSVIEVLCRSTTSALLQHIWRTRENWEHGPLPDPFRFDDERDWRIAADPKNELTQKMTTLKNNAETTANEASQEINAIEDDEIPRMETLVADRSARVEEWQTSFQVILDSIEEWKRCNAGAYDQEKFALQMQQPNVKLSGVSDEMFGDVHALERDYESLWVIEVLLRGMQENDPLQYYLRKLQELGVDERTIERQIANQADVREKNRLIDARNKYRRLTVHARSPLFDQARGLDQRMEDAKRRLAVAQNSLESAQNMAKEVDVVLDFLRFAKIHIVATEIPCIDCGMWFKENQNDQGSCRHWIKKKHLLVVWKHHFQHTADLEGIEVYDVEEFPDEPLYGTMNCGTFALPLQLNRKLAENRDWVEWREGRAASEDFRKWRLDVFNTT